MQKGQLGTSVQRRVIFVWEGTLAHLPKGSGPGAVESVCRKIGRYERAVSYWKIHDTNVAVVWTLFQRTDYRIDLVVTTREDGFAKAVGDLSLRNGWPFRYVFATPAPVLGRRLPYMADVDRVFYGLEEQRFHFGPHGYFLGPHHVGQIA
jgi:hypothetical protein